jgi:DNA repair exonuclease SbcCD nuclease subunit
MPVYVPAGNHDDRRALVRAYPGVRTHDGCFIQTAFDMTPCRLPHAAFAGRSARFRTDHSLIK